jgi:hypothetical protein
MKLRPEYELFTASDTDAVRTRVLHAKDPHVIGLPPRSMYGDVEEAVAWRIAVQASAGTIRAVFVFANRRVIGVIQGRGVFSSWVRCRKFAQSYRFKWSAAYQTLEDFENTPWPKDVPEVSLMPFQDGNAIMDSLTNGKNGQTWYSKAFTATGVANSWYDLWQVNGVPAPGAINGSAFTANIWTDASVGAINHRGNVSTDTKHTLAMGGASSANTPWVTLYDRIVSYDLCTFNAAANQALTNTNVAARYNSGAPGALCFICVCAVTGATAANLTQLRYTNQAGSTLQVMPTTPTVTFIPSAAFTANTTGQRVIVPSISGQVVTMGWAVPLAAGDSGMSLVHDYTTSAANTGSFCIVIAYPLVGIILPIATVPAERDSVYQMMELERIYDGACVSALTLMPATTAYTVTGRVKYGWHS